MALRPRAGPRAELSQVRSLAVLPFQRLGAAEEDYLGLALADALITRMGQLESLAVRPTSAVRRYTGSPADAVELGRKLRVDAVLDGTVQRSGERTRVTVQLVGVRGGASFWSGQFEAQAVELFALEDTITSALLGELAAELTADERDRLTRHRTVAPAAYAAYLHGRYHWNRRIGPDFRTAIRFFERAIAEDPGFAAAHAGLADAYNFLPEPALAEVAARRALELDPRLANAHAALGNVFLFHDRDWRQADEELRQAIALNPSYASAHQWLAFLLAAQGRFPEALASIRRARDVDPTSPILQTDVGVILRLSRRYAEAAAVIEAVERLDPSFVQAHYAMAEVCLAQRRVAAASSAERRAAAALAATAARPGWSMPALIAAHGGDGVRARELARQAGAEGTFAWNHALVEAALGNPGEALEWLERAAAHGEGPVILAGVDPLPDGVRGDARFTAFVRRLGLPNVAPGPAR